MNIINIENYSDFEKSLKNVELNSYSSIAQFQDYFDRIAKYILGHVAIVIGDSNSKQIKYYLEEIEFYYNNGKIPEEEITFTKDKKEKKKKKNYFLARINVKEMRNSYFGTIVVLIYVSNLMKHAMEGFLFEALLKNTWIKKESL